MRIRKTKEKILYPENTKGEIEQILEVVYKYKEYEVRIRIRWYTKNDRKNLIKQAKEQATKYFANKIVEEWIKMKEQ